MTKSARVDDMNQKQYYYKPPGVPVEAGTPGFNENGVPLHACNGVRQDEHYWAWLTAKRLSKEPT